MKKYLALLLALCMVFALCACGQSEAPAEETPAEEAPAAEDAGTDAAATGLGSRRPRHHDRLLCRR